MLWLCIGFNADPDPGSQTNADPYGTDPDPGQTLPSLNVRVGNKKPSQKNPKNPPKKTTKNVFWGVFWVF
jgi:hypothetical protein